ncbi:TRAP transporter small permease [Vibrio nigripulchritudo]|uniref:TRAP transporter small permease n=1 Tax=Vibrio nigripulchritudo TaxID=28173 RepID=UPI00190B3EC2|nr:TRAP transporter small permease [Vibrio nigripulchritudo]
MKSFRKHLNNIEEYTCCLLLASFVILLFLQIVLRQSIQYSIPWGDEVATYMFVWFAYLGAVVAAKMSAHNRVSFHFRFFPPVVKTVCETIADLIWVAFNLYFVYLSYDFVFNKMNLFWKSQTTGIPMKYFYLILPIAFFLMSVRILWNNYEKLVLGIEATDPESEEIQKHSLKDDFLKNKFSKSTAYKAE